jgi:hypothetical protein
MDTVNSKRAIGSVLLGGIGALGIICAGFLALYLLAADEHESRSTNTKSTQLKTSAERVAFLSRYLKLRTRVNDAAFHIVYHDNSVGVPGPSDWSIAAAVQVTPADGPTWLAGARPLGANDVNGLQTPSTAGLIPGEWQVSSSGEKYARDGALIVWHPEGVLEFAAATK